MARAAAGAQNCQRLPVQVGGLLQRPHGADEVGVVTGEPAVPVVDGVDRADCPGRRIEFVQKRHDGGFIGHRYAHPRMPKVLMA